MTQVQPSDFDLMDASLDGVAEKGFDITEDVYAAFFEKRPDARQYFKFEDIDPQGQGRMLTELLELLQDQARGRLHVRSSVRTIAADHLSYGVAALDLYTDFIEALRTTLRDSAGEAWTPETDAAWRRQAERLVKTIGRLPAKAPAA